MPCVRREKKKSRSSGWKNTHPYLFLLRSLHTASAMSTIAPAITMRAKRCPQEGDYKWAIIKAHSTLFHAAMSPVMSAGYIGKEP
ncbi:MAG TPA: hypothetical protein PK445_06295 [Methanolinea sp.]|nr:hypothetical protein [Methanolinea sp.]HQJ19035.1 hypothetical protein [Methanolinea sp.]